MMGTLILTHSSTLEKVSGAFTSTKPNKDKLGKESKKSPYKSETREECTTSKSKPRIALAMVKLSTSEAVESLPLITR